MATMNPAEAVELLEKHMSEVNEPIRSAIGMAIAYTRGLENLISRTAANRSREELKPGEVIQLDPSRVDWGPLLCIVDKVAANYVRAYWLVPVARDTPPQRGYIRLDMDAFVRIGPCAWKVIDPETESADG